MLGCNLLLQAEERLVYPGSRQSYLHEMVSDLVVVLIDILGESRIGVFNIG